MKQQNSSRVLEAIKKARKLSISFISPKQIKKTEQIIDDDVFDLKLAELTAKSTPKLLKNIRSGHKKLNNRLIRAIKRPSKELVLIVEAKGGVKREIKLDYHNAMAFQPPEPKLPKFAINLGGMVVQIPQKGNRLPILPDLDIARKFPLRPWRPRDWIIWDGLLPLLQCLAIPAKATRVEIPVSGSPAMVKVARNCSRAYVVNNQGLGSVINVITENVDATFQVAPHPSPARPYPPGVADNPIVSPFIKGGLNQKYKRLYVPASFYIGDGTGGFYVAVVDVDPASSSYLDTIGWIDCGWLPEQVSFTNDGETGVITNYMEGTATIFRVSDHTPLDEVELFTGAGVDQLDPVLPGLNGTFARSVVTTHLPGKGNVALNTLTDDTGFPGFSVIELDSAAHTRTNVTRPEFGFIDGIAVTPQKDRVLLVDASNNQLHVYNINGNNFNFDKSIDLPSTGAGRVYMGGIAVRPTGNLAFLGTGRSQFTGINALTCVNYVTGTVIDLPENIENGTWDLVIRSFGIPLKPYIFVVSTSGFLTIIPC